MPKMSIYVPDELWQHVQAHAPGVKPSTVIQEALQRYVARSSAPTPFGGEPLKISPEEVVKIRQRLADTWRTKYRAGFDAAVLLASCMPWEAFEQLQALNWDIALWINESKKRRVVTRSPFAEMSVQPVFAGESIVTYSPAEPFFDDIEKAVTSDYTHIKAYRDGFRDGFQQVWETIGEST